MSIQIIKLILLVVNLFDNIQLIFLCVDSLGLRWALLQQTDWSLDRDLAVLITDYQLLNTSKPLLIKNERKSRYIASSSWTCSSKGISCPGAKGGSWWALTWENSNQHQKSEVDIGALSIHRHGQPHHHLFRPGRISCKRLQALPLQQRPTTDEQIAKWKKVIKLIWEEK